MCQTSSRVIVRQGKNDRSGEAPVRLQSPADANARKISPGGERQGRAAAQVLEQSVVGRICRCIAGQVTTGTVTQQAGGLGRPVRVAGRREGLADID